jgi:hypothetical protein
MASPPFLLSRREEAVLYIVNEYLIFQNKKPIPPSPFPEGRERCFIS